MAATPQVKLRDGSGYNSNLVFTTNQESIVLEGTVDVNTADIQVSINGANFVSDPTLVKFNLPAFTVPNLDNFPNGLALVPGLNTVRVRTIDIVGGVSGPANVEITKLRQIDVPQVEIPTGIQVRRRRNAVDILAAIPKTANSPFGGPTPNYFRGFHFYASLSPSGTSGYYRINDKLVTVASSVYEETATTFGTDSTVWQAETLQNLRVKVTEENEYGDTLATRLDRIYSVAQYTRNLRFASTLEEVELTEFISFRHLREGGVGIVNEDQFSGVSSSEPLYYVVSAVYFDPQTGEEFESPYSQEVLGNPLVIDTAIRDLPGRNQFNVVTDFIRAIQRVNAEISLIPGSTTRDVSIDPFSSEAERLYFLLDFVHRAQSFLTLLQIDDANNDGVSDLVEASAYKTALQAALGFTSTGAVQGLIDSAFDKLAGNVSKPRLPGRPSVGQAVFYTTSKPTVDLVVPSGTIVTSEADSTTGSPSARFRVGGTYTLLASQADAYYNFDEKRYEIVVDLVAEQIGGAGNKTANQIKNAQGVSGLSVTNTEATVFGRDRESNAELAERALLGFTSVDTGTEGGYSANSAAQIGVIKAKVVKSGDALMMRDYDPVRKKHIGGKVDIWVQGLRERQVTEKFAFSFEVARDIQCQVIDLGTLTIRVQDSRVTASTPITELLNNQSQGLGVRNVTQGLDYLLTGAVIVDYQTFRLNPALAGQPVTAFDDVITADYRFRSINQFRFSFQPVRRIVSVTGEVSGTLNSTLGYSLFKTDDPLLEGESTIANDHLVINQVAGIPTGGTITVNAESHVLIGFTEEPLVSIGINTKTLRVFNQSRTVEYAGPETTSPDFEIINGTATTPVRIVRTSSSTIVNGSTVSVDYAHDENFTVTYVINDLLQQLQRTLDYKRHVAADPIVKQSIQNSLDGETTVQMLKGSTKDKVDPLLRSNVSMELNRRLIGQGIAQSDFINTVDSTPGVDFQVIPLAKMAYSDGSRKLREALASNSKLLPTLDAGGNRAYILTGALKFPTTDGGGLATEHRGVFQDDEAMVLASSLSLVASGPNQAFIIGSAGALIEGYTDTATLVAAGFTTTETQQVEFLRRTANHVVVALSGSTLLEDPSKHTYTASYVIRGDSGSKDITSSGVEFIDLGNLTVTYRLAGDA